VAIAKANADGSACGFVVSAAGSSPASRIHSGTLPPLVVIVLLGALSVAISAHAVRGRVGPCVSGAGVASIVWRIVSYQRATAAPLAIAGTRTRTRAACA
jgi:hypothetical protein